MLGERRRRISTRSETQPITDLADANPVTSPDPIVAGGMAAPYRIGELLVENNYDPVARADAPDHLEIQILNEGATDLSGWTDYYTITDADNGERESYVYHSDLVVSAGGEGRIHIDAGTTDGHLRTNPNSNYVTSLAGKHVTIAVQADGYQAAMAEIEKDPGGAETAD